MDPNRTTQSEDAAFEHLMPRERRVVLVCDVVESVRWMEQHEDEAIARWSRFAREVREHIAPAHEGSVVKSTGDGLMIEFASAPQAIQAAHRLQAVAAEGNAALPEDRQMRLRVGVHAADVRRDAHDLYGRGVNLAARITTLARAGDIVMSPEVRDELTNHLDGVIEDMGECFFKHLEQPLRAYRISAVRQAQSQERPSKTSDPDWGIGFAVVPFGTLSFEPALSGYGRIVADALSNRLSKCAALRVTSRLSVDALAGRGLDAKAMQGLLGAKYFVSGSCTVQRDRVVVNIELSMPETGEVVWADSQSAPVGDVLEPNSEFLNLLANQLQDQAVRAEFQQASGRPLPTVRSYSLLLSAVTLMHRMGKRDFVMARDCLEHLSERHPRNPTPRSWLAKWHSLAIAQQWTTDVDLEAQKANAWISSALDLDPADALALTIKGQLLGYVQKEFGSATNYYEAALRSNPSESLAWIGLSTVRAWTGDSRAAVECANRAIALSPLDPLRYYFESLAAYAYLTDGRYDESIALSQSSVRSNGGLASTHRVLAMAHALKGDLASAQKAGQRTRELEPHFTVAAFMQRSPAFRAPRGQEFAQALLEAGIPMG